MSHLKVVSRKADTWPATFCTHLHLTFDPSKTFKGLQYHLLVTYSLLKAGNDRKVIVDTGSTVNPVVWTHTRS